MFTFCKARWARQKKKQKENHATKVTKIPKTKRRKYGINETQESMILHIAIYFGLSLYVFKDVTTVFVTLLLVQKIVHYLDVTKQSKEPHKLTFLICHS